MGGREGHVLSHGLSTERPFSRSIRVYQTDKGPAVFRLRDHVGPGCSRAGVMAIPPKFGGKEYGLEDLIEAVKQVVRENKDVDYLKPFVFLRGEDVGLNPVNVPASMSITGINMGMYLGKDAEKGAKIITSSWHRPDNYPAGTKIGSTYVTSCLAKRGSGAGSQRGGHAQQQRLRGGMHRGDIHLQTRQDLYP